MECLAERKLSFFYLLGEINVLVKPFLSVHNVPDTDTVTVCLELAVSVMIFKFYFIKTN